MKKIQCSTLAMLAIVLVVAGSAARAQQRAYSVPISSKVVKLEVRVPDGHWIKAMVQEGDQLRIEDRSLNLTMAFIPVRNSGRLRIRAFRIEKHAGGNESMHFVEDIDTAVGETGYTKKAAAAFALKVLDVVDLPAEPDTSGDPPAKNS